MNKTVAPEPWLHLTPARSMNLPGKHRTSNACSPCTLRLLTPTLLTRSRPLARPSRACGFAHIPFAASQAAQVSFGEEREKAVAAFMVKGRCANFREILSPTCGGEGEEDIERF